MSATDSMLVSAWVRPDSANVGGNHELIVGRVVHVYPDGDAKVAWLSNERGLWQNDEVVGDFVVIEPPQIGVVEAILVSAHPTTPWVKL